VARQRAAIRATALAAACGDEPAAPEVEAKIAVYLRRIQGDLLPVVSGIFVQHGMHGFQQLVFPFSIDEYPIAVVDDFRYAPYACRNDGKAATQRFQQHTWKVLIPAEKEQEI